jgi:hypothetical protein
MSDHTAGETRVDETAVDAVLTASRSLIALATRSLGGAAGETTIPQYLALVVLASRGPYRMVDLAGALDAVGQATGRRRALIAEILAKLPLSTQDAVARAHPARMVASGCAGAAARA